MIVHDKILLENVRLLEHAKSLQTAGFISKEQKELIKKELPAFKSHSNLLVRLGFFILGVLLYFSLCAVISLAALGGIEDSYFKCCFYIFTVIGIAGAELLSREKYFGHGLDDAFILGAILNFGIALAITTDGDALLIAIFVAAVSFLLYRRYLHLLSLLVFCMASLAVLFYGLFEMGIIGQSVLPFIAMLLSALFYFVTKKINTDPKKKYYHDGLLLANSFCLILFYLSCNYMVVRELSSNLLGAELTAGQDIPFSYFFYAFTFIVPAVYLVQSLRTKDRIMLWVSFFTIGFSIYTIRYYYSVVPVEIALSLGGLVLFGIAYFSIKKLKHNKAGLTFKPDRINNSPAFLNAEALIVASAFGLQPEAKIDKSPMEFGGGGFSGGGAGENF